MITSNKLDMNDPAIQYLVNMTRSRHEIPEATVDHPKGVIVPNDPFMTEKLKDRNYVPYCTPCTLMQRLRRVEDGFICPSCGNKANWDLTKFNGNINVQYENKTDVK
jgi:hypothetical protein